MRVKRLEIQGFKSFKDKTVIHFDNNITGIVGPNGCGKSNIVDAFFWVMGEQSYKHMRGANVGDLIFNGSQKYSPLGMAEATLVMETDVVDLENAPAGASVADIPPPVLHTKEISVTRRVYRSGEGEYFINGVPSRLKDIHELFMDTGIGTKGYSVIEQGQIGKIVNSKPEERRLLIEEAAGIAKYKARKKESLRKMEAAQGNLSRLTDVIQEIERSLGSLERQAQKARQYKKYKEELLDKELTWGRRKASVFEQKLETLRKQKEVAEQEFVGLKASLSQFEMEMESDRISQTTDSKSVEDYQNIIQILASELTREQSALELSRRRQGDLENQLEKLHNEKNSLDLSIEESRERFEEKQEEIEALEGQYNESSSTFQAQDEEVRALRKTLEEARRELDQTKRSLMNGVTEASDLHSTAAALASRAELLSAQLVRLNEAAIELNQKAATIKTEYDEVEVQHELIQQKKVELSGLCSSQKEEVQFLSQSLKEKQKEGDLLNKQLTQVKSRLSSLEELAAAHEGFGDGPKAALDWAKQNGFTSALQPLSNLFQIQAGYELSVEGILEASLESLYTTNNEAAFNAIHYLSSEQSGRASFILESLTADTPEVLQTKDGVEISEALKKNNISVLGRLSQFVTFNLKNQDLFKNVWVVESLEPAIQLLNHSADIFRGIALVSTSGEALDYRFGYGLLKGGSTQSDSSTSVLGRKRAISELQEQVVVLENQYSVWETDTEALRTQLQSIEEELDVNQNELRTLDIQNASLERDIHQFQRSFKEIENQINHNAREIERTEHEIQSLSEKRQETELRVKDILSQRSDLEQKIEEKESKHQIQEEEFRAQELLVQDLKMQENSLRERLQSSKRELNSLQNVLQDRERRLADIVAILEKASEERNQHSGGDTSMEDKIKEISLQLAEKRELLAEIKDRLEITNAKITTAMTGMKELHQVSEKTSNIINQSAVEIERIQSELSFLIQNLEEKYGIGCLQQSSLSPIQEEMSEPVITTEMSEEEEKELGVEVEKLRERIRRLGEVNVMAIEEFEEVSKRFEHLSNEKKDLEGSIVNLQNAIEHINKTSEVRFKKAFETIADRFERLFPIIFGGGSAKLSLLFPEGSDDVLEAGVDILAQPPGKKVANITLLSGGEKALTAVSLIFAIFMVKPSPFCLLDEVDAPLDDANIGKFNALLREMSAKSQFILITHNKKTMELNDSLYGVTMEEPGVSKLVSIQMQ